MKFINVYLIGQATLVWSVFLFVQSEGRFSASSKRTKDSLKLLEDFLYTDPDEENLWLELNLDDDPRSESLHSSFNKNNDKYSSVDIIQENTPNSQEYDYSWSNFDEQYFKSENSDNSHQMEENYYDGNSPRNQNTEIILLETPEEELIRNLRFSENFDGPTTLSFESEKPIITGQAPSPAIISPPASNINTMTENEKDQPLDDKYGYGPSPTDGYGSSPTDSDNFQTPKERCVGCDHFLTSSYLGYEEPSNDGTNSKSIFNFFQVTPVPETQIPTTFKPLLPFNFTTRIRSLFKDILTTKKPFFAFENGKFQPSQNTSTTILNNSDNHNKVTIQKAELLSSKRMQSNAVFNNSDDCSISSYVLIDTSCLPLATITLDHSSNVTSNESRPETNINNKKDSFRSNLNEPITMVEKIEVTKNTANILPDNNFNFTKNSSVNSDILNGDITADTNTPTDNNNYMNINNSVNTENPRADITTDTNKPTDNIYYMNSTTSVNTEIQRADITNDAHFVANSSAVISNTEKDVIDINFKENIEALNIEEENANKTNNVETIQVRSDLSLVNSTVNSESFGHDLSTYTNYVTNSLLKNSENDVKPLDITLKENIDNTGLKFVIVGPVEGIITGLNPTNLLTSNQKLGKEQELTNDKIILSGYNGNMFEIGGIKKIDLSNLEQVSKIIPSYINNEQALSNLHSEDINSKELFYNTVSALGKISAELVGSSKSSAEDSDYISKKKLNSLVNKNDTDYYYVYEYDDMENTTVNNNNNNIKNNSTNMMGYQGNYNYITNHNVKNINKTTVLRNDQKIHIIKAGPITVNNLNQNSNEEYTDYEYDQLQIGRNLGKNEKNFKLMEGVGKDINEKTKNKFKVTSRGRKNKPKNIHDKNEIEVVEKLVPSKQGKKSQKVSQRSANDNSYENSEESYEDDEESSEYNYDSSEESTTDLKQDDDVEEYKDVPYSKRNRKQNTARPNSNNGKKYSRFKNNKIKDTAVNTNIAKSKVKTGKNIGDKNKKKSNSKKESRPTNLNHDEDEDYYYDDSSEKEENGKIIPNSNFNNIAGSRDYGLGKQKQRVLDNDQIIRVNKNNKNDDGDSNQDYFEKVSNENPTRISVNENGDHSAFGDLQKSQKIQDDVDGKFKGNFNKLGGSNGSGNKNQIRENYSSNGSNKESTSYSNGPGDGYNGNGDGNTNRSGSPGNFINNNFNIGDGMNNLVNINDNQSQRKDYIPTKVKNQQNTHENFNQNKYDNNLEIPQNNEHQGIISNEDSNNFNLNNKKYQLQEKFNGHFGILSNGNLANSIKTNSRTINAQTMKPNNFRSNENIVQNGRSGGGIFTAGIFRNSVAKNKKELSNTGDTEQSTYVFYNGEIRNNNENQGRSINNGNNREIPKNPDESNNNIGSNESVGSTYSSYDNNFNKENGISTGNNQNSFPNNEMRNKNEDNEIRNNGISSSAQGKYDGNGHINNKGYEHSGKGMNGYDDNKRNTPNVGIIDNYDVNINLGQGLVNYNSNNKGNEYFGKGMTGYDDNKDNIPNTGIKDTYDVNINSRQGLDNNNNHKGYENSGKGMTGYNDNKGNVPNIGVRDNYDANINSGQRLDNNINGYEYSANGMIGYDDVKSYTPNTGITNKYDVNLISGQGMYDNKSYLRNPDKMKYFEGKTNHGRITNENDEGRNIQNSGIGKNVNGYANSGKGTYEYDDFINNIPNSGVGNNNNDGNDYTGNGMTGYDDAKNNIPNIGTKNQYDINSGRGMYEQNFKNEVPNPGSGYDDGRIISNSGMEKNMYNYKNSGKEIYDIKSKETYNNIGKNFEGNTNIGRGNDNGNSIHDIGVRNYDVKFIPDTGMRGYKGSIPNSGPENSNNGYPYSDKGMHGYDDYILEMLKTAGMYGYNENNDKYNKENIPTNYRHFNKGSAIPNKELGTVFGDILKMIHGPPLPLSNEIPGGSTYSDISNTRGPTTPNFVIQNEVKIFNEKDIPIKNSFEVLNSQKGSFVYFDLPESSPKGAGSKPRRPFSINSPPTNGYAPLEVSKNNGYSPPDISIPNNYSPHKVLINDGYSPPEIPVTKSYSPPKVSIKKGYNSPEVPVNKAYFPPENSISNDYSPPATSVSYRKYPRPEVPAVHSPRPRPIPMIVTLSPHLHHVTPFPIITSLPYSTHFQRVTSVPHISPIPLVTPVHHKTPFPKRYPLHYYRRGTPIPHSMPIPGTPRYVHPVYRDSPAPTFLPYGAHRYAAGFIEGPQSHNPNSLLAYNLHRIRNPYNGRSRRYGHGYGKL